MMIFEDDTFGGNWVWKWLGGAVSQHDGIYAFVREGELPFSLSISISISLYLYLPREDTARR